MDIENLSGFPASVMAGGVMTRPPSIETLAKTKRGLPEGIQVRGLLIVKCTLEEKDGAWTPAKEQLPIWDQDEKGPPFMEKDLVFQKVGVDLAVIGSARPPGDDPVGQMTVTVSIGNRSKSLAVFGNRHWSKRWMKFAPSDPEPFSEMPLSLENAFGGETVDKEGQPVSFPLNEKGKGYTYPHKESRKEGVPLPNIEDPSNLISTFEDHPDPTGFCFLPVTNGIRMRAGIVPNPGFFPDILPGLHNAAFPDMVLPAYPAGETLMIEGMTAPGPWRVKLPAFPACAELRTPEGAQPLPLEPDTLCVQVDRRRLYITAKGRFDYDLEHPPTLTAVVRPAKGGG